MECAECRELRRELAGYEARCDDVRLKIEATLERGNRREMEALKIDLATHRMYAGMTLIEMDRHRALVHADGSALSPPAVMGAGR